MPDQQESVNKTLNRISRLSLVSAGLFWQGGEKQRKFAMARTYKNAITEQCLKSSWWVSPETKRKLL